jgi:hypothetical protein
MSNLTITGSVGPGIDVSDMVINNLTSFDVDVVNKVITVYANDEFVNSFDISGATTFTVSISGDNYTVKIDE